MYYGGEFWHCVLRCNCAGNAYERKKFYGKKKDSLVYQFIEKCPYCKDYYWHVVPKSLFEDVKKVLPERKAGLIIPIEKERYENSNNSQ